MHSRKITSLWTLLALAAAIVSGLPIIQVDDDDLDCGPWDDEADPTTSVVYTSNTATTTPTPLILLPSTTSSSSSLRISTSLVQASPTGSPSSTNSFVAPANSFVPVTPPSYAFYIQSSSSGSDSSSGLYAAVSAGVGGSATFTANKNAATRFTIDSSGDLVEQRPSQGYVARLDPQINAQQVAFDVYDGNNSYGRLNCQRQGGEVSCNVGGVPYQAAVCGTDGRLYFTRTAAIGCTAIKLVPVFP